MAAQPTDTGFLDQHGPRLRRIFAGDLLDAGMTLYRHSPWQLLRMTLFVMVPCVVIKAFLLAVAPSTMIGTLGSGLSGTFAAALLVSWLVQMLLVFPLLHVVLLPLIRATDSSLPAVPPRSFSRLLLGVGLLRLLAIFLAFMPFVLILMLPLALRGFAFLLCLFLALALFTRFVLAPYALLGENDTLRSAVRQSLALSRRTIGVFSTLIFFFAGLQCVILSLALLFAIFLLPTLSSMTTVASLPLAIVALALLLGDLLLAMVLPWQIATWTVLYYALRLRREGLDLQQRVLAES